MVVLRIFGLGTIKSKITKDPIEFVFMRIILFFYKLTGSILKHKYISMFVLMSCNDVVYFIYHVASVRHHCE